MRFITGSRFARTVEATGAEHLALPAEADYDDRQGWNERFPKRAALKGTKAIAHDIEHVLVRPRLNRCRLFEAAHTTCRPVVRDARGSGRQLYILARDPISAPRTRARPATRSWW